MIADKCQDCGAERPSWLGSSHYETDHMRKEHHVLKCRDGRSPEEFFSTWYPPYYTSRRNHWPVS